MAEERADPESVVDRQVAAYNDHDVEAFAATYAADAVVAAFDEDEPMAEGRAEIRATYADLFESAAPEATVRDRLVLGEYVVDHERVERADGAEVEALGVYRVVDGEIAALWLAHG